MGRPTFQGEFARFLAVAVAGVIADIAIAWALHRFLGLPLWLSAATGFTLAALGNYVAHELWTFRRANARLSAARAVQYVSVSLATLGVRLAAVAGLEASGLGLSALAILVAAAGLSFLAGFVASKLLIFRPRP